jgi:hypothetical protein
MVLSLHITQDRTTKKKQIESVKNGLNSVLVVRDGEREA